MQIYMVAYGGKFAIVRTIEMITYMLNKFSDSFANVEHMALT